MSEITSVLPILTEGDVYRVTSPFGYRADPVSGAGNGQHKGIDLVLWRGYGDLSAVGAAWDGTVIAVRDEVPGFEKARSAGNYVVIDHGGGTVTRYYHLAHGSVAVSPGEHISAGQLLGQMGSTGYSTGAHLHFQLEADGVPVDPLPYLTGEEMLFMDDLPTSLESEEKLHSLPTLPAQRRIKV